MRNGTWLLASLLLLTRVASAADSFDSIVGAAGLGMSEQVLKLKKATAARKPATAPAPEPAEKILPRFQQKKFPAPAAGACGLKSFTVEDYEVRTREGDYDRARISVMGAVIDTTSPDCVRDYGVVQFIRGCVYHTRHAIDTGAELERTLDVARPLRGPRVVFNHPTFEVDQMDLDPLYAADTSEADRMGLFYVPHSPLRLKSDAASQLADLKFFDDPSLRTFLQDYDKPTAVTYVADVPEGGVSFADEEKTRVTASNASLDFKTCVYRIKDVPTTGDPKGPDAAPEEGGPLQCFAWSSRYNYDGAKREFVTDQFGDVDPYCSQAPARAPLPGS